jgi:hypothetical protein
VGLLDEKAGRCAQSVELLKSAALEFGPVQPAAPRELV